MAAQAFKARHCGEDFAGAEGAAQLAAHMKAHRAEPANRGRFLTLRKGPSHLPAAWKAPRVPAGGLDRLAAALDAGTYDLTFAFAGGTHRETYRMGEAA